MTIVSVVMVSNSKKYVFHAHKDLYSGSVGSLLSCTEYADPNVALPSDVENVGGHSQLEAAGVAVRIRVGYKTSTGVAKQVFLMCPVDKLGAAKGGLRGQTLKKDGTDLGKVTGCGVPRRATMR
jgi:hypothetical protein